MKYLIYYSENAMPVPFNPITDTGCYDGIINITDIVEKYKTHYNTELINHLAQSCIFDKLYRFNDFHKTYQVLVYAVDGEKYELLMEIA